jgi:hypothetical protein
LAAGAVRLRISVSDGFVCSFCAFTFFVLPVILAVQFARTAGTNQFT